MNKQKKDYLALALDNYSEREKLLALVKQTKEYISTFKIGLEQFIRFGPDIVTAVQAYNVKIFLDLKLHDIPNTVAKAVQSASELRVDYLTIHTTGGTAMMKAAVKAAKSCTNPPKLIGVTVLTSIDQQALNEDLKVTGDVSSHVAHLAMTAVNAGLDGIVCSAADLPDVKILIPEGFEIITPGIRPMGSDIGDQKRVATPEEAIKNGSTMLVLGRAITSSTNPEEAAKNIFLL